MIQRFNRPVINVADMEKSLAFYRDLLGLKVISDNRTTDPARAGTKGVLEKAWSVTDLNLRWVVLAMPNAIDREIELLHWINVNPKRRPRSRVPRVSDNGVAWQAFSPVEGLKGLYNRLKRKGIKFLGPLTEFASSGRGICYALDPDGYIVEMSGTL